MFDTNEILQIRLSRPLSACSIKSFCPGSACNHVEPADLLAIKLACVDPLRRVIALWSIRVSIVMVSIACIVVVSPKNAFVFWK